LFFTTLTKLFIIHNNSSDKQPTYSVALTTMPTVLRFS